MPSFDPDYYYLLSALDLAQFTTVGLYHHPGTTAVAFGAVVIHIVHAASHSPESLQLAVLTAPGSFLSAINVGAAAVNALALLVLGIVAFRVTGKAWLGILIQLAPLWSAVVLVETLARFKAEPFMLTACILFLAVTVVYMYAKERRETALAVAYAVVCGFGLATKFTFFPVVAIPVLVLPGMRRKALFLAGTAVSTIVFTLPIANRYSQLASWTERVAFHTGMYGDGARGLVDSASYWEFASALASANPLLVTFIPFASLVLLAAAAKGLKGGATDVERRELRVLGAMVFSLSLGIVVASKYFATQEAGRYLLTSFCLMGFAVLLCLKTVSRQGLLPTIVRALAVIVLLGGVVLQTKDIPAEVSLNLRNRALARDIFVERQSVVAALHETGLHDHAKVLDTFFPSSAYALLQASIYSTGQQDALRTLYGDFYFCNGCTASDWPEAPLVGFDLTRQWSAGDLKQAYGDKIVLVLGPTPTISVLDGR